MGRARARVRLSGRPTSAARHADSWSPACVHAWEGIDDVHIDVDSRGRRCYTGSTGRRRRRDGVLEAARLWRASSKDGHRERDRSETGAGCRRELGRLVGALFWPRLSGGVPAVLTGHAGSLVASLSTARGTGRGGRPCHSDTAHTWLYAIGGCDADGTIPCSAGLYYPTINRWSAVSSLTSAGIVPPAFLDKATCRADTGVRESSRGNHQHA
jgi:hypothetical protein